MVEKILACFGRFLVWCIGLAGEKGETRQEEQLSQEILSEWLGGQEEEFWQQ